MNERAKKFFEMFTTICVILVFVCIGMIIGQIIADTHLNNTAPIVRANEYLEYTPMSFPELVDQLAYEFTYDDAIYGASNCGADWNVVAGRCAEAYIDKNGDVPRALLKAELMIKGFTEDQAEFACDYVGVD